MAVLVTCATLLPSGLTLHGSHGHGAERERQPSAEVGVGAPREVERKKPKTTWQPMAWLAMVIAMINVGYQINYVMNYECWIAHIPRINRHC